MYDPLDYLNNFMRNPLGGLGLPRQQQAPAFPPLDREQEESFLGGATRKLLGGLGYVGGLLDKQIGGRAVRGLASGNPRELLSLLPFSDTLGITDESEAVSGKQLLEQAGLLDRGSEGFWPTVAGIGADIALSPATYLSFGGSALTQAGKAASKIGALPRTTAERIKGITSLAPEAQQAAQELGINAASVLNQPLGGVAKLKFPFVGEGTVLGAGPGGEAFLGALGATGQALGHGRFSPFRLPWEYAAQPVLEGVQRFGRAMFQKPYAGSITKLGQGVAPGMMAGREAIRTQLDKFLANKAVEMRDLGMLGRSDLIRDTLEGISPPGGFAAADQALLPHAQRIGKEFVDYLDTMRQSGVQLGHDAPLLNEINLRTGQQIGYGPRHSAPTEPGGIAEAWAQANRAGGPQYQMAPSALSPREEWTRGLDWRTANQFRQDQELLLPLGQGALPNLVQRAGKVQQELGLPPQRVGPALAQRQQLEEAERLSRLTPQQALAQGYQPNVAATAGTPLTQAQMDTLLDIHRFDASKGIVKRLASMDPALAKKEMFSQHILDDVRETGLALGTRNTSSEAVHQLLGQSLAPLGAAGTEHFVPLTPQLLQQQLGFGANWQNAAQGILAEAAKAGKSFRSITDVAMDPTHLAEATRWVQGFTTPTALRPIVTLVDWFTNTFKALQTSPWPGFHFRNSLSAMLAHVATGGKDPRFGAMLGYVKPYQDAWKLTRGEVVDDAHLLPQLAGRGLTPQQATDELRKLAFAHRAGSGKITEATDIVGGVGGEAAVLQRIPGMQPVNTQGLVQPGWWNPLALRGSAGNLESRYWPARAGERLGETIEDVSRLATFIAKARQGYSFNEASKISQATHVDYKNLADFERSIMRRLVPFYTWQRGMIPHVVKSMLERPGGLYGASSLAASEVRSQQEQFIPEYLGGGLALPLGEEKEGKQRYLTKLDVNPAESVFDVLRPSVAKTGMSLLGQLNPLLKGPLEAATGKQFFSGRNLEDLYSATGMPGVEQLITNSPFSRMFTAGRTLLDQRKYEGAYALPVNLLTGARVSDVDVDRQREYAARDLISDSLRGSKAVHFFEKPYVRAGDEPLLSPAEVALMRLNAGLEKRAAERKKKEEQGRGIGPKR